MYESPSLDPKQEHTVICSLWEFLTIVLIASAITGFCGYVAGRTDQHMFDLLNRPDCKTTTDTVQPNGDRIRTCVIEITKFPRLRQRRNWES